MALNPKHQLEYLRSAGLALRRAFVGKRNLVALAACTVTLCLLTTALLLCVPVNPMRLSLGPWPTALPGPGGATAERYLRSGNGSVDGAWRCTFWAEPQFVGTADAAAEFRSLLPAPMNPRWPGHFLGGDASERLRGICETQGAVEAAAVGWPLPWLMVVSPMKGPTIGNRGLVEDSAHSQRSVLAQYVDGHGVQLGVWYGGAARSLAYHAAVVTGLFAAAVLVRHHLKWRAEADARRRRSCPACGYSRKGIPPENVCPECGHAGLAEGACSV